MSTTFDPTHPELQSLLATLRILAEADEVGFPNHLYWRLLAENVDWMPEYSRMLNAISIAILNTHWYLHNSPHYNATDQAFLAFIEAIRDGIDQNPSWTTIFITHLASASGYQMDTMPVITMFVCVRRLLKFLLPIPAQPIATHLNRPMIAQTVTN